MFIIEDVNDLEIKPNKLFGFSIDFLKGEDEIKISSAQSYSKLVFGDIVVCNILYFNSSDYCLSDEDIISEYKDKYPEASGFWVAYVEGSSRFYKNYSDILNDEDIQDIETIRPSYYGKAGLVFPDQESLKETFMMIINNKFIDNLRFCSIVLSESRKTLWIKDGYDFD